MPIQTDEEIERNFTLSETEDADRIKLVDEFGLISKCHPTQQYPGPDGRCYYNNRPWHAATNSKFVPESLYLYYVKFSSGGALKSYVFEQDLSSGAADLDARVKSCIESVLNNTPMTTMTNVEGVKWSKPCYLAIFVDHDAWRLIDAKADQSTRSRAVEPSYSLHFHVADRRGYSTRQNQTFYSAQNRTLSLDLPDTSTREIRYLVCENHHLIPGTNNRRIKPQNSDPKHWDNYKFDLYYRLDISGAPAGTKLTMIIDPGGHNTGPDDP